MDKTRSDHLRNFFDFNRDGLLVYGGSSQARLVKAGS